MTDELPPAPTRPGYRGRCLYKTGKCANERALKTSGAPHNLCEEHRNRQNQHQRKLDAKNRVARKDKRKTPSPSGSPVSGAAAAAIGSASARYAPYPTSTGGKRRGGDAHDAVDDSEAPVPATGATASVAGLQGLAAAPVVHPHAALPHLAAHVDAAAAAGMVYLPNGPQPPQLAAYPFVMQDFDGIVVPLPSYLEGQDRVEFRARIYQKVLDFISEECILRFGGGNAAPAPATNREATDAAAAGPSPATTTTTTAASASSNTKPSSADGATSTHSGSSTDSLAGGSPPFVIAGQGQQATGDAGRRTAARDSAEPDHTAGGAASPTSISDRAAASAGTPGSASSTASPATVSSKRSKRARS